MSELTPLQADAEETIQFLKDQHLITAEHSLTISLIRQLCIAFGECVNQTQRAGISKELRAAMEMLPKPEAPEKSDEASDFFKELENA